jgi:putative ABC transport system substrate-binding protein
MRRRDIIRLLGSAALLPCGARAVQARRYTVGVLTGNVEGDAAAEARVRAFQEGLYARRDTIPGEIHFEIRWPGPDLSRQQDFARALVALSPDVILATSTSATKALQKATRSIPIVFVGLSDPTATGVVSNLTRPEGNATGFMLYEPRMAEKWVSLLQSVVPSLSHLSVFFNPDTSPSAKSYVQSAEEQAQKLKIKVKAASVKHAGEIDSAVASAAQSPGGGLIVLPDGGFTAVNRTTLIEATAKYRLPAIYGARFYVEAGGLMSYGADLRSHFRDGANYVDEILRGALPSDLPVQLPSRFHFAINRITARALGLAIPRDMMFDAELIP